MVVFYALFLKETFREVPKLRVKVTHKFKDRYTGETHYKGDVLEISMERYEEIKAVGDFVFPIAEDAYSDGLDEMSIRELREYADKTYKLTFKGGMKKAEIIEELRRMEQHG